MWQWIKSKIINPVADFFSGIIASIQGCFVSNPYQPIPVDDDHEKAPIVIAIEKKSTASNTEDSPLSTISEEIFTPEIAPRLATQLTTQELVSFACTSSQNLSFFQKLLSIVKAAHDIIVKPSVIEIRKKLDTLDVESLKAFLRRKVEKNR